MTRFGRILKVRPGEGRTAALGVAMMLLPATSAAVGQSGVDALFFARSGVDKLPVMLIVSGGLIFAISVVVAALLGRLPPRRLFRAMPLVLAGVLSAERALTLVHPSWIYPVLWLSAGAAVMLQGLFTWGMVGMVVDTRQAKRLFPLFAAGGIFGAVIGGLLTPALAGWLGAENLLLIWGAGLVATYTVGRTLLAGLSQSKALRRRTHRQRTSLVAEMQEGLRFVRGSSVMKWMAVAAVLFSVLYFSLYLPFSRAATDRFIGADSLAGFFGLFSAATTGAALVASVFLSNRLFARFGVTTLLVVLPVIYFGGFSFLIVNAAFVVLVAFRFVQMVWMSSIASPAWESVINAVPAARRDQTRAFMNGGPAQAGTIIAGLILLVGVESLSAVQLYTIGLVTAALTILATWRVRRSYSAWLIDALRIGRPELFPTTADDEAFSGRLVDGGAVATVVVGATDTDVHVRRAAVEILGDLPSDQAVLALHGALHDSDATVRATALRSLIRTGDASVISESVRGLSDPNAAVRLAAVRAIDIRGDGSSESTDMIRGVLGDEDSVVRAAAAAIILRNVSHEDALQVVREMGAADDPELRVLALGALEGSGLAEAFEFGARALEDSSPLVRGAAAGAIASSDQTRAIGLLLSALGDEDEGVRESVATALGRFGSPALEPVTAALFNPERADGALRALERLPVESTAVVRGFAQEETARAVADFKVSRMIDFLKDDGRRLLYDSLMERARAQGLRSLRAAALLEDGESIRFATDSLSSRDRVEVANALEALESLGEPTIIRPLLQLWEPPDPRSSSQEAWLPQLLDDPDSWIRECAMLLRDPATEGAPMAEAISTLSDIERVLFLRKVPLFADLPPQDLKRIAAIALERIFVDDETIAGQGESGEELYIVVEGEVRVLRDEERGGVQERELARRGPGDVVGEMAIITREPRMASVVASGDVRTLSVDRKAFEGVLRERPDTALAVIRVLSQRLIESAGLPAPE